MIIIAAFFITLFLFVFLPYLIGNKLSPTESFFYKTMEGLQQVLLILILFLFLSGMMFLIAVGIKLIF